MLHLTMLSNAMEFIDHRLVERYVNEIVDGVTALAEPFNDTQLCGLSQSFVVAIANTYLETDGNLIGYICFNCKEFVIKIGDEFNTGFDQCDGHKLLTFTLERN